MRAVCTKPLLSGTFDKGYSLTIHIISVGFIILRWTPAISWVGYINTIKDFTGSGN
jgi:hypothetical protein